jgi:hypothetical protein
MGNLNVDFHVSVLTVPDFVKPEDFPAWLRHEASAIQDLSQRNSLTIVRLFLDSRIKAAIPRKKLDALLQTVTNSYPAIFRMEMVVVDEALDHDEIELIESDAEQELAEILEIAERVQQQREAKGRLH